MNIGILTFHKPINYGAFLQAFSLSNKIKEIYPDSNINIIDYFPPREKKNIKLNMLRSFKHHGFTGVMRCHYKNKAFQKSYRYLMLSEKINAKYDMQRLFDYIESTYDVLIIGSDAIFNWNQTGFPTPFIPQRKLRIPVLFYAASVHGMKYLDEDKSKIDICKSAFINSSYVGVRDNCSKNFVRYCSIDSNPIHCCDPTFFINAKQIIKNAGNYKKRIKDKYGISLNEKYIVIMSPNNALTNIITSTYKREYTIIHVFEGDNNDKCFLYDLTPFEWAEVLAHASAVITRFFHGTLLSLIRGVPALVIDYSNYDGKYESKLRDLMKTRLCLNELYYTINDVNELVMKDKNSILSIFDQMLNGNYKNQIIKSVAIERNSAHSFFDCLSKLIEDLQ